MKVFIQSKSGDLNASLMFDDSFGLVEVMQQLRKSGGYPTEYRSKAVFAPFEEIEYIRELGPDE